LLHQTLDLVILYIFHLNSVQDWKLKSIININILIKNISNKKWQMEV
ncbi:16122_t:CDS:1, partial [Gigaspora margarita]